MNWKTIKWKIRYYFQYFPFTVNSAVCGLAVWAAARLVSSATPKQGEDVSPFFPFVVVMGKLAVLFFAALAALSVLSTFYSYLYYQFRHNSTGSFMDVDIKPEVKNGRSVLILSARIEGIIRPLLGFINGRLFYDDNVMTDQFSLLSNQKKEKSRWRSAIGGRSYLVLPDIKEYELKGGFIYFQDMLHLVSLAMAHPMTGHFYRPPTLTPPDEREVFPKKTEQAEIRTETLRRIDGDLLNYKDFESGDDVRRIVWKVYARNRELMVRTPELFEPYASHLYFYASFYAAGRAGLQQDGYMKEMLNYYKNRVWTVYDTLTKKEWALKYFPDIPFSSPENLTEADRCAHTIANSTWQKDVDISGYFNPRTGAVLCISSFADLKDLEDTLQKCDSGTMIYYVKVSKALTKYAAFGLLSRLLFLPPDDRLAKLRSKWLLSPLRLSVRKREKELEALLNRSGIPWGEL